MAAQTATQTRIADRQLDRDSGSYRHHGVGGAFFRPAEDISLMRISPSGMSRHSSSGTLDAPAREASPVRFARAGSSGLAASGGEAAAATAYRGPFGHLGEDPDFDAAAVTTDHIVE